MAKAVREPIQVYLTQSERAELDRVAARLGVSRSEVLRRGVESIATETPLASAPTDLVAEGLVTPPRRGMAGPPVSQAVAPLHEILAELDAGRDDR